MSQLLLIVLGVTNSQDEFGQPVFAHYSHLKEGSFFGEGSLVYQRRSVTAVARISSEVLVWEFAHARSVMKRYPALWVKLKIIAARRREQLALHSRKYVYVTSCAVVSCAASVHFARCFFCVVVTDSDGHLPLLLLLLLLLLPFALRCAGPF